MRGLHCCEAKVPTICPATRGCAEKTGVPKKLYILGVLDLHHLNI